MAQFPSSTDPSNLVNSSMPIMSQGLNLFPDLSMNDGLVVDQGSNVNNEFNMIQGIPGGPFPMTFNFGAANVSSLPTPNHIDTSSVSPQSVPIMSSMYTQAPLPPAGFHSQNSPGTYSNQSSPQFMDSAIPIDGAGTVGRMNTSFSSIGTNQTDMTGASGFTDNNAFESGLASPFAGTPMVRNDSSSTEYSGVMSGVISSADTVRPSGAETIRSNDTVRVRTSMETILAEYPEYASYLAESENHARRNSGNNAPKRPRRPRNENQTPEAKENRKKQNREAQRSYRQRKDLELINARVTSNDLMGKQVKARNDIADLKEDLALANAEIRRLNGELTMLKKFCGQH